VGETVGLEPFESVIELVEPPEEIVIVFVVESVVVVTEFDEDVVDVESEAVILNVPN